MAKSSSAVASAPRTLNLKGYRVVIAGVGPFRGGEVIAHERLAASGIDADRLAQLISRGDLAEEWE